MYRIILSFTLALSTMLPSISIAAAFPSVKVNPSKHLIPTYISSPQKYEEYLTKCGETEPEALKIKKSFSTLPMSEKKKFIYYINNPEIMREVMNKLVIDTKGKGEIEDSLYKEQQLYGGDIILRDKSSVIEVENNIEPTPPTHNFFISLLVNEVSAAPATKDFKATHTQTLIIKGVKVMEVSAWVFYKAQGSNVISTISGGAYFYNLIPLWTVEKQSVETGVYRNKAQTCAVYKAKSLSLYGLFSSDISIVHHDVLGFANGSKTYRLWR